MVKGEVGTSLIDLAIKENFLDLIDDKTIEYISHEEMYRGKKYYNCEIQIKESTPLFKVSEQLMVATERLKDEGFRISLQNINTYDKSISIKFSCYSWYKTE